MTQREVRRMIVDMIRYPEESEKIHEWADKISGAACDVVPTVARSIIKFRKYFDHEKHESVIFKLVEIVYRRAEDAHADWVVKLLRLDIFTKIPNKTISRDLMTVLWNADDTSVVPALEQHEIILGKRIDQEKGWSKNVVRYELNELRSLIGYLTREQRLSQD